MDKWKLQGTWQAVRAEMDGREAPNADIERFQIMIKGDTLTFLPDNRSSLFALDQGKLPKTIDLTPNSGPAKGKKLSAGIYRLEGTELYLCLNNVSDDARPSQFKTLPGDGMRLLVLKKLKDQQ